MTEKDLTEKALQLGAEKVERRINWVWAWKFPTKIAADNFIDVCVNDGIEVRGPADFGENDPRGISVGFRI